MLKERGAVKRRGSGLSCEACAVCRRVVGLHEKRRWFFFSVAWNCCAVCPPLLLLLPWSHSFGLCRLPTAFSRWSESMPERTRLKRGAVSRQNWIWFYYEEEEENCRFVLTVSCERVFFSLFLWRATQFWLIHCGLSINNCFIRVCLMHRFVLNCCSSKTLRLNLYDFLLLRHAAQLIR
jgi:hypothetical protein